MVSGHRAGKVSPHCLAINRRPQAGTYHNDRLHQPVSPHQRCKKKPRDKVQSMHPDSVGDRLPQLRRPMLDLSWSDRDGDFPMPRENLARNHMQQPPRTLSRTLRASHNHGFTGRDYLYRGILMLHAAKREGKPRTRWCWASSDKD